MSTEAIFLRSTAMFIFARYTGANFVTTSYQKISGFDRPHVSEMLSDSKISTLEGGLKNFRICLRIRRMRVDVLLYPERKSCELKNIRIRVDGA